MQAIKSVLVIFVHILGEMLFRLADWYMFSGLKYSLTCSLSLAVFFFLGAFYSSPSLPYVKWILCLQQHALQNSKMSVHVEKVDSCSLWIQIEVFDASVISLM